MTYHTPVLLGETIELLDPKVNQIFIDATLGNAGHTIEILKKGAVVYGIEQDPINLQLATDRINSENLHHKFFPIHGNFNQLSQIFYQSIKKQPDGIFFDFGISQNQLLGNNRGFSFNDNLSLDMRLDPDRQEISAEYIINTYSFDELYKIFSKYSQEKFSKPLIINIIKARQKKPIKTASDLALIIRDYFQKKGIKTNIDPSTKIFLALRIAVNDELENIRTALNQTTTISKPGTIVCTITFNSGEDRIVKNFIKRNFPNSAKSIKPKPAEIAGNPLSRSAILRSYRIS